MLYLILLLLSFVLAEELVCNWEQNIIDTEIHLNDLDAVPRKGSMIIGLTPFLPDRMRFYVAGRLSFSEANLRTLNVLDNRVDHLLEPFIFQEMNHFVAVESTSILGPKGQTSNLNICLLEAKWLSTHAKRVIASIPLLHNSDAAIQNYLVGLSQIPAVIGVRINLKRASGNPPHTHLLTLKLESIISSLPSGANQLPLVEILVSSDQLMKTVLPLARFFKEKIAFVVVIDSNPDSSFEDMLKLFSEMENIVFKVLYFKELPRIAELMVKYNFHEGRLIFGSNLPFQKPIIDDYYSMWQEVMNYLPTEVFVDNPKKLYNINF